MNNAVTIVRVSLNDANTLLELSRKTFFDAFLSTNNPADMEAYASTAFTLPKFQFELINPNSAFYFALVDNEIAGYIKLNYVDAQTELQDPDALEIERIYILEAYQGQQIGKLLIDFAIQTAIRKNLKFIWLGVWEHNTKAIGFYKSKGFKQLGSHQFMLGNDEQTDILMKKEL